MTQASKIAAEPELGNNANRGGGRLLRACAVVFAIGSAVLLILSGSVCIYHDTCIKTTTAGHDWCGNLAGAIQWPAGGSIEDAVPVLDGSAPPQGCQCFNDAENDILDDEVPACKLQQLQAEIEQAARQQCQSLVAPGHDHNCWTSTGPNASTLEGIFLKKQPGQCTGSCAFSGPPLNGSCPDLNPYQCATGGDGEACEPMSDSADAGTGADSTGTGATDAGVGAPDADRMKGDER